ncbi:histidine kinase [Cellulomonas sp. NS3]|uniref:histidine kinase n=1 Tax=Cellulomonas sp. NS3 TaxID=2973977 RepID=UPI0021633D77|nr:histidine kinase [Cellulomonas sp. NS3]
MPDESHESPQSSPDAVPATPGDADAGTTPAAPTTPADAGTTPADAGAPVAADAAPASTPIPDEAELARVAEPATVRRAPKFRAFVTAGVLLGAVLGFTVALVTGSAARGDGGTGFISFLDGQGSARLLVALAGALLGALVAGIAAIVADRRSMRGR